MRASKLIFWIIFISYIVLDTYGKEFYFITTPTVLLSDAIHKFNCFVSTNVSLVIETTHLASNISSRTDIIFLKNGYQSITYFVPFIGRHLGSSLKLRFLGDISSSKPLTEVRGQFINEAREIDILIDNFIIFSETDKPVYKPGDLVKLRAIAIYATNLMPTPEIRGPYVKILLNNDIFYNVPTLKEKRNSFDSITIEAPNNTIMAQWYNIPFEDAMTKSLQLSKDPSFGKWKITYILGSKKEVSTFVVKKYMLPRFVVEVYPPAAPLISETSTTVRICATYSNGKNLQAFIRGQMCIHIERPICRAFASSLKGTTKCTNITIADSLFELNNRRNTYFRKPASFKVTVTENGTIDEVSKSITFLDMKKSLYTIKLKSKNYYKPGLPYFGKLSLIRHDGRVQQNTSVLISANSNYFQYWTFEKIHTSDDMGVVEFTIPYISVNSHINLQVVGDQVDNVLEKPSLFEKISVWKSLDNEYLQISPFKDDVQCPGRIKLEIMMNRDVSLNVLYMQILSRGILNKIVEYPPLSLRSTSQRQYNGNNVFQTYIDLDLTEEMGPDLHIVVYYFNENREVIADDMEINKGLTNCFWVGKGDFKFDRETATPGDVVKLSLDPGTVKRSCAVRISDVALSQFGTSSNINLGNLVAKLLELNHKIIKEGARKNGRESCSNEPKGYDSRKSFAKSGMTTITNVRFVRDNCGGMQVAPMPISNDPSSLNTDLNYAPMPNIGPGSPDRSAEVLSTLSTETDQIKQQIRAFFIENWVFDYYKVTPVELNLKVPDSITKWRANAFCMTENGIWMPPSRYLTVILPFFVDIYMPYSIKIGEQLQLPVKLFNYVHACYEIDVELHVDDNEISVTGPNSLTTCICANDIKTLHFKIRSTIIGNLNVTVKAKSKYSTNCSNRQKDDKIVNYFESVRRQLLSEARGVPSETTYSEIICVKNEQIGLRSPFRIPTNIVRGSLRTYVVYNGVVMGQTFDNLDWLIQLPTGCGEQSLATLVPSIYVLKYLSDLKIVNIDLINKARQYILEGFRRQQSFRNVDGSYSVYPPRNNGSTWLTAFVIKTFTDASKYVSIVGFSLKESMQYLANKQRSNGCFEEHGTVLFRNMESHIMNNGVTDETLLTAYVLISLQGTNISNTRIDIAKAIVCVTSTLPRNLSTYGLALIGYSLSIYSPSNVVTVLNRLKDLSLSEGRYTYWRSRADMIGPINSADIETTSYAMLALNNYETWSFLSSIVYWLSSRQNSHGGYPSSQDTVVALHAISVFALKHRTTYFDKVNLNISLDNTLARSDVITNSDRFITRQIEIGSRDVRQISVTASGAGCVSIQLKSLYNIEKRYSAAEEFNISVTSVLTDVRRCTKLELEVCSSYLRMDRNSNMVLITVDFPSGWGLNNVEKAEIMKQRTAPLQIIDILDNKVHLYYDSFSYSVENKERCFTLRLDEVNKVTDLKPSIVQIIDYYWPQIYTYTSYEVPRSMCTTF